MKWLIILLLAVPAFSQQTEVTVFGEGLFVPVKTGGIGGRIGYDVGRISLEAEGSAYFHSATSANLQFNKGFSFLGGPLVPIWRRAHIFATAKGGTIHQKTYFNITVSQSQLVQTSNFGVGFVGLGAEIGSDKGLRIDAGDLLSSSGRLNNFRLTAGIFFHF